MNTNNKQYDLIIRNANIIDVETGNIIKDTDIAILEDRIIKIGKSIAADDSVNVIDTTGKFVIPGLWDMHVHNWFYNSYHPMYLANGVTGIRDMCCHYPFTSKLKQKIKNKEILGPEIISASGIIDGPNPAWSFTDSIITEKEGRDIVNHYIKSGAEFIKVYSLLPKEAFDGISNECAKQNIPFAGHIPLCINYIYAAKAGQKSVEHLDGVVEYCISTYRDNKDFYINLANFDDNKFNEIMQVTKEKNVWHCPTMAINRYYPLKLDDVSFKDERFKYLNQSSLQQWFSSPDWKQKENKGVEGVKKFCDMLKEIVGRFNANGIKFIGGTDLGNPFTIAGFTLHDELEIFVECGFSPLQSLQTVTLNPAIFLDRMVDFGTVSENKIANLVILNKNPLENIKNTTSIDAVVQRGDLYNRTELDNLLQEVEDFFKRKSLNEILFEQIQDGKFEEILNDCQSGLVMTNRPKLEQLDTELVNLTGKLIESNSFEYAEKIALLNVDLHKDNAMALCKLGEYFLINNKQNEMEAVLKIAFDISDKNIGDLNTILWTMIKSKNYNLVKEYALKSLEIYPFVNNFKFFLAHSMLLSGDVEKAKEFYLTYKESLIRGNDLKEIKEIGIENSDLDKMIVFFYDQNGYESADLSNAELEMFCGEYRCEEDGLERKVYLKDGFLYYWRNEKSESKIFPISKNEFKWAGSKSETILKFDIKEDSKNISFMENGVCTSFFGSK